MDHFGGVVFLSVEARAEESPLNLRHWQGRRGGPVGLGAGLF